MDKLFYLIFISLTFATCQKGDELNKSLTLTELLDIELELFEGEFEGEIYHKQNGPRTFETKLEIDFKNDGTYEALVQDRKPFPALTFTEIRTYSFDDDNDIISWSRIDTAYLVNNSTICQREYTCLRLFSPKYP